MKDSEVAQATKEVFALLEAKEMDSEKIGQVLRAALKIYYPSLHVILAEQIKEISVCR